MSLLYLHDPLKCHLQSALYACKYVNIFDSQLAQATAVTSMNHTTRVQATAVTSLNHTTCVQATLWPSVCIKFLQSIFFMFSFWI
jgi:hypothetical protein